MSSKSSSPPSLAEITEASAIRRQKFYEEALKVCLFIFFLGFKPSEPHLSKFLAEEKGLSDAEINNSVYPVWTYSYLAVLPVWGVIAELVGYKTSIVLGAVGRFVTRLLLLYGEGLWQMQVLEVTYAFGSGAEVVLGSYVFHLVGKEDYQRIVSYWTIAYLTGHVLAGVLGDVLFNNAGFSLMTLEWISAASCFLAVLVSLGFTSVSRTKTPALLEIVKAVKSVYSVPGYVVHASWWMAANAIYMIIYGYETSLYKAVAPSSSSWNGSVFAAALLGAIIPALLPSRKKVERQITANPLATVALGSWLVAGAAGVMAMYREWAVIVGFVLFFAFYVFQNTFFSGQTGRLLESLQEEKGTNAECFATVFVFNNFLSVAVQTFLTFLIFTWLNLDIEVAFRIFAIVLGGLAATASLCSVALHLPSLRGSRAHAYGALTSSKRNGNREPSPIF